MAIVELYKSAQVAATSQATHSYLVPNTKRFRILDFWAETPTADLCAVAILWDTAGANISLWNIKSSNKMPTLAGPSTLQTNGNGVKILSLTLNNGGTSSVYMSGFARIWVED